MVTDLAAKQQHAQHLLARLDSDKLDAVVHLLETMVPDEDGDTLSPAEQKAIAELGLTMADWERMSTESWNGNGQTNRMDRPGQGLAHSNEDAIEQPIALQILKTLARHVRTGEGATKQLQGVHPPMIRLRAQNHRDFFRDHDNYLEIDRFRQHAPAGPQSTLGLVGRKSSGPARRPPGEAVRVTGGNH